MNPARTATGGFPVGLRQGGGEWQRDPAELVRWAASERFACLDFDKQSAAAGLRALRMAGLAAGTVDLFGREDYDVVIAPDSARRQRAIAAVAESVDARAAEGAAIFFAVTLPADSGLGRRRNFDTVVESFSALVPVLERTGTRVAMEGWPGPGAVCCTPETFRAFFDAVNSDRFGINYDPSHLVRMGIDPLRFAREFAGRVFHVHAKDAAVSEDDLYEYGHEQPPTFRQPPRWSGAAWRYTIPGRGRTPWPEVFRTLRDAGYAGQVTIELEDANFHGTTADEQRGLLLSRDFLEACC